MAISNSRLLDVTPTEVTFRTRGADKATLSPVEFLRRFLLHVLPDGFHKIRHYGLYASTNVETRDGAPAPRGQEEAAGSARMASRHRHAAPRLSAEEEEYIELKLRLSDGFRRRRAQRQLTQADVAKLIRSSQSRVAKMEAGDPSVSLDLLIRSLFALGASRAELARIIPHKRVEKAA